MISIYKSFENNVSVLSDLEEGAWINLVNPSSYEIEYVSTRTGIDTSHLSAALDEEERSRIEVDNGQTLILVDVPFLVDEVRQYLYETIPLAIIYTARYIVTVCLKDVSVLHQFAKNDVKTFYTYKKSRFILQILYKNATLYLYYLKHIDKQSNVIENELHKSMKNKELIQLLALEKSLVYFSTSLRSNELVLERLLRLDFIRKYPDDTELLEDTIIENKQAIEMSKIYSDILTGTMDAFASIISNNLNIVMKLLTSITIVMAIPTIIASLFGMNVPVPLANNPYGFFIVLFASLITCGCVIFFMLRRKMF